MVDPFFYQSSSCLHKAKIQFCAPKDHLEFRSPCNNKDLL